MSYLGTLAVNFGRVATFIQVLFYLPLALDIAGQDAFLALSASLASYYLFLSTVRLLTNGTRLAWIGQTLAVFQFVVVPACLLVCFNVYSPPSATIFPPRRPDSLDKTASEAISSLFTRKSSRTAHLDPDALDDLHSLTGVARLDHLVSASVAFFFWLARRVPRWWHTLLRISSPFFSLLEGVASLLVIQSLASTSRWIIASSLTAPSARYSPRAGAAPGQSQPKSAAWVSNTFIMRSLASIGFGASEVWQIFFLLVSATIYVTAAFALYVSFDGATKDRPGTAAAIATSVTSTLWLTAIAFAMRKGNVIETSLMFAYVVFNIYQLGPSLSFTPDPISLIRSFKVDTHARTFVDKLPRSLQASLTGKLLQAASGLVEVIAHWLGQSVDFLHAAAAALPKSVIVSLVYRLMVLYAASRILPMLKGSVAPREPAEREHGAAQWGRAAHQAGEDESDWSSLSGTESDSSSEEGTEVEELEEEVWDDDEGRWVLQRRRLRRRTRRRTPMDAAIDTESESDTDGAKYSEDDSGIAYHEPSLADQLKEPEPGIEATLQSAPSAAASGAGAGRARGKARRRRRGAPRAPAASQPEATQEAVGGSSGVRKRPSMSRPPSARTHKRARPTTPTPPSPHAAAAAGETPPFGSAISIVVSYSRLILIAVYSHLLLLDQANQIYWRFLTVAITLLLWGLEIVIATEDVVVGGVGELGSAATRS